MSGIGARSTLAAALLAALLAPNLAMAAAPAATAKAPKASAAKKSAADEERDKKRALEIYERGKGKLATEDFLGAAADFEEANTLFRSANILFAAGQAWERAKKPARAADAYSRALLIGKFKGDFEEQTRQRMGELRPQIGLLSVTGSALSVSVDGGAPQAVPLEVWLDPGHHEILVEVAPKKQEKREFDVAPGSRKELRFEAPKPVAAKAKPKAAVVAAESKPANATSEPAATDWLLVGGFSTAGLGLGVLVGGLTMGMAANAAGDAYNAAPNAVTYEHANDLASTTNALIISGGVLTLVGGGVAAWRLIDGNERGSGGSLSLQLQPLPNGVVARGRF